ncbi:hypothetical protein ASZ90_016998 [hydrocarbon metagenome]|uniref:Uncharacterized protein n=1 Tax=hydrocarbon metagenome TaxID=938273 RepID=A0A0W8EB07_9ZZZZ
MPRIHVVEDPVPHDQETRDDYGGKHPCGDEGQDEWKRTPTWRCRFLNC